MFKDVFNKQQSNKKVPRPQVPMKKDRSQEKSNYLEAKIIDKRLFSKSAHRYRETFSPIMHELTERQKATGVSHPRPRKKSPLCHIGSSHSRLKNNSTLKTTQKFSDTRYSNTKDYTGNYTLSPEILHKSESSKLHEPKVNYNQVQSVEHFQSKSNKMDKEKNKENSISQLLEKPKTNMINNIITFEKSLINSKQNSNSNLHEVGNKEVFERPKKESSKKEAKESSHYKESQTNVTNNSINSPLKKIFFDFINLIF